MHFSPRTFYRLGSEGVNSSIKYFRSVQFSGSVSSNTHRVVYTRLCKWPELREKKSNGKKLEKKPEVT